MTYQQADSFQMHSARSGAVLLFLIGLFSQTQVNLGGKLGISEFAMLLCAPFVFVKNYTMFRRDGSLYFFILAILWLIGAIYVDVSTHNNFRFMMRGIAVPMVVFANSACIYVLLRKNFDNLKWFLLGSAISGVVSIFVFQQGMAGDLAAEYGLEAGVERMVSYKLFWVNQFTTWLVLPIAGWYLKVPKMYSIVALSFLAVFDLVTGGRSAFLCTIISLMFILVIGKSQKSVRALKKHMVTLVVILLACAYVGKAVYKWAATSGLMGEYEERKYEGQAAQKSALSMLMTGRSEFFIGLMAVIDKPIIGHGSCAIDNHGYILDFASKYGTNEGLMELVKRRDKYGVRTIPAHSHIVNYWLWHGIFACLFWVAVFVLSIKTLFRRMHVVMPWTGYFATGIPIFLWDIFFSPFGLRVQKAALFVTFLLVSKLARAQANASRWK